ncbi:MAG: hypothetical protein MAG431_01753 [Chloroflexi bacterium]|nr:hypothetical protein [Chloroflexota bacterium]
MLFIPIAILALLSTSLALLILQWRMEEFKFAIFLAGGAAVLAWVLLLLARTHLPIELVMPRRGAENLFSAPLTLYIDATSWAIALSLIGFGAGVLLNYREQSQLFSMLTLSMTAMGVLASFSANPITLLYSWTLIDVLIFLSLLHGANERVRWAGIMNAFIIRILSLAFVIVASLVAQRQGDALTFAAIPSSVNAYLIVAAVLHLGIWLPRNSFERLPGLESVLRVVPTGTGLALIVRTAEAGFPPSFQLIFFYFVIGIALLSGLVWAMSGARQVSPRAWMVGMGALSAGAALMGYPNASLVWAMALFLGSVPLFVAQWSTPISVLSLLCFLGLTALPFTPLWPGAEVYNAGGWGILLGGSHGLLAGGYLKIILARHKSRLKFAFWEIWPAILGLVILFITPVIVSLGIGRLSGRSVMESSPWLGSLLAAGTVAGVMVVKQLSPSVPEPMLTVLSPLGQLPRLVTQVLNILYDLLSRLINFLTEVFEGEGGVIWTLVGAFFLITILASLRGG